METHDGESDELPPPPPLNPGDEPLKAEETKQPSKPKRDLVPRKGFGRKGQPIRLVTNHFKVSLNNTDEHFYHYNVNLKYEDDEPVEAKGWGRKVIDILHQTYASELANKDFAYDGEKSLFTIGALPQINNEFTVVLEDVSTGKDGVSESQFNQVLNIELDQIIEACKFLDEKWSPKITLIVAQKNHHTKFFMPDSAQNVPPGTVVDNKVCHPLNYDFYMCSHAGMIGTTRPTHYHILHDEIGFTPDDLQELVHSLSYVYQRSTTAISVVAPIYYAHLAAA